MPRRSVDFAASGGEGIHAEPGLIWGIGPRATAYAGLYFLLPLLARLGIAEQLAAAPDLLEWNLPDRVLRRLARRLGVEEDDPILAPLARDDDPGALAPLPFVVPARWREGLAVPGAWTVHRHGPPHPSRSLWDGSGRLPLALWQGAAPGGVRALAGDREVRRGGSRSPTFGVELLLDAWLVALRRWCRRHARLGLVDLVRRPGAIAATPTHLDVVFDLGRADLRVRRAGLDFDPGWLPWFGRVVLFHYVEREAWL